MEKATRKLKNGSAAQNFKQIDQIMVTVFVKVFRIFEHFSKKIMENQKKKNLKYRRKKIFCLF